MLLAGVRALAVDSASDECGLTAMAEKVIAYRLTESTAGLHPAEEAGIHRKAT